MAGGPVPAIIVPSTPVPSNVVAANLAAVEIAAAAIVVMVVVNGRVVGHGGNLHDHHMRCFAYINLRVSRPATATPGQKTEPTSLRTMWSMLRSASAQIVSDGLAHAVEPGISAPSLTYRPR